MNTTFNRRCLIVFLSIICAPAWADGTITHLSGEVSVQKGNGATLPGTVGAKVGQSDTMITGASGYARLEMTDGGEMVLRPNSQLKVESYRFHPDKPADDSFVFRMVKGGLRTVTGLIGKRGNKDAYEGKTETATIGIRGTQFDMRVCQGDCGALANGTYLAVRFGAVHTGNAQGGMDVAAGQVALVQQAKPPVLLPRDPGVGFTPPPVIPKLDEKKKVQAAAAAATPAENKPAAASPEKSSQSNTDSGKKDSKPSDSSGAKGTSDKASTESGSETKDSGSADSGKKSGSDTGKTDTSKSDGKSSSDTGGKSESPSKASTGTSSGSASTTGSQDKAGADSGAVTKENSSSDTGSKPASDSGGKSGSSSGSQAGTSSSGSGGGSGNSATQNSSATNTQQAPAQAAAPTAPAAPATRAVECSVQ